MKRGLLLFAACLSLSLEAGQVVRVGPGERITRIADAARVARDGDIVEILPGEYRGDVAVWHQKQLTIRGLDPRPVLVADGRSAEGKAIWVIRDGDFRIDNLEFRGARVVDGNGAGIRFENGRLRVSDSVFADNQTGILTGNRAEAELYVERCVFADAPRQNHSLPHLLYAGRIARLEVSGSRFHRGYRGHLIKSRARYNEIRYNLIHDGDGGEASYEIDLPNGGVAWIVGNVVAQSAASQNAVLIAYGAEAQPWPDSALYLAHNTLLSARKGELLRVWRERLPATVEVVAINNLAVGAGTLAPAGPGDYQGNAAVAEDLLSAPERLDFTLPADAPVRRLGVAPGTARGRSLAPAAEFALPVGSRALDPAGPWAPGAFQRPVYAPRPAAGLEFPDRRAAQAAGNVTPTDSRKDP